MTLRTEEILSKENYPLGYVSKSAPFTQEWFFGEWQQAVGRKVRRFAIHEGEQTVATLQCIVFPLGSKKYVYCPYGPVVRGELSGTLISELRDLAKKIAVEEAAIFVRFDFIPTLSGSDAALAGRFFKRSSLATYHSSYFQPRVDWCLDLSPSEEKLLAALDAKHRYGLRHAEKNAVTTEIISEQFTKQFDTFLSLMKETAARDGFSLHPEKYYRAIFHNLEQHKNGFLTLGTHEGKVVSINIIILSGNTAMYLVAGADTESRPLMPAYATVWASILESKRQGAAVFNFGAVSTSEDLHTSWEGLSRFKRRFGGYELHHSPFFDYVHNKAWYFLYTLKKRLLK